MSYRRGDYKKGRRGAFGSKVVPAVRKMKKLYEVRRYLEYPGFSKTVGFKGRLVERPVAVKIVARLRKCGVDAFAAPMRVWA